eukprot:11170228-Lingulodinium_polyedra.AAC.1
MSWLWQRYAQVVGVLLFVVVCFLGVGGFRPALPGRFWSPRPALGGDSHLRRVRIWPAVSRTAPGAP